MNKLCPISISVFFFLFLFRFIYKTMTKQFRKKTCTETAISEAVCLLNSPQLEKSDDLSKKGCV